MPQQTINLGSAPDDGTGDTLRDGGDKINDNFTELYTDKADKAGGTFTGDIIVPDEAYDATAWNGSLEVPTKNALRDKIETLGAGTITELDDVPDVNAPTPSNGDVLTWDSTPGEWVAAAPSAGIAELDDVPDVNAPSPSNGDVLTWDSTPGEWVAAAPTGGGLSSGTGFPGSPSTDDLFYRTDRDILYFYDGSQWLSTQLIPIQFGVQAAAGATADGGIGRAAIPYFGVYSLYIVAIDFTSFLSGTAIWNLNVNYVNAANASTLIGTRSTSGDAANNWIAAQVSVAAALSANARVLELVLDETTGSATAFCNATIQARLIG